MGLGAELCALAAEADVLDVPPVRVAMPDIPGIPVDDVLEDAVLPNRATIRDALVRLVARARSRRAARRARRTIRRSRRRRASWRSRCRRSTRASRSMRSCDAARAFPRCNATFAWTGIVEHADVVVDLDLGPPRPRAGSARSRSSTTAPRGSDLAIPFVRPGQTAAVRIGAVRDGRAYVACAVDHRAVDGADVGRFLAAFKTAAEGGAPPLTTLAVTHDAG